MRPPATFGLLLTKRNQPMFRTLPLFTLALVPLFGSAQNLNNITWNPGTPDECDYVAMNVIGNFPGQNYQPDSFFVVPNGFTITVNLYCSGSGGGGQTPFSQPLPQSGPYVAGSYTVNGFLFINGNQVDTWTGSKTVTPATIPDPGGYAEEEVCNSDANFQLISVLGGSPDAGGVWLDPNLNPVTNGIFDPGQSQQGFYTYEFDQNFPCVDTSQQVLITYLPNSSAGMNGSAQVCVNAPPFNLFNFLGGVPDAGGAWTYQGNSVPAVFTPGTSQAGAYTYTVPGIAPCGNPSAVVNVTVTQPGNPGTGLAVEVCDTDTSFQLSSALTGSPSQAGTWYDPNGFVVGGFASAFNALVDFPGNWEYRVTVPPCDPAVATVTITLTNAQPPCGNVDCQGVAGGTALPGTPCNDNDPNTLWDAWNVNCDCVGSPIGIDEPAAAATMVLQPNPATEGITIESPAGLVVGYELYTLDGRLARAQSVNALRTVVERSDLAAGTYRIVVRFADGRAARAVVFE